MLTFVNVLTATFAVISVVITVKLYLLVRTPSLLVLTVAVAWLAGVRVVVAVAQTTSPEHWLTSNTTYLLIPFWPLLALGFWLLLRVLENLQLNGNGFKK
jgi:hypothetical protein